MSKNKRNALRPKTGKPTGRATGRSGKEKEVVGKHSSRFGLVSFLADLIDELAKFDSPADAVLSDYFKKYAFLGSRDRGILAEGAYCWLRFRLRINHLAESGAGGASLRQAKLALLWSGASEEVWAKGRPEDNDWLSRVININASDLAMEPKTCLPEWLFTKLQTQFGTERAYIFAASMLKGAPLDIRANTLKSTAEDVTKALQAEGFKLEPIANLPDGLRVEGKPPLGRTNYFQDGWFEVQDAGSQWVSRLVAPRRGDLVVDFCAGAGGKTLAIAALMRNTGRIVAIDTSERRLQKLKPRAARAGVSNCSTMVINDEADPRLNTYFGKADRVVVDTPCTGMGTLRRNPDLKFRQDQRSVAELVEKQKSIIEHASRLVKADGRLVYITCSVLREENEDIVEDFLAKNPEFRLRRWVEVLNPNERPEGADQSTDTLRLWPDQSNSDGFFAAVLQRSKVASATAAQQQEAVEE